MARKTNTTAATAQLAEVETQIRAISIEPLYDARIKVVRPGGTAGAPSKERGYARLIYADGRSKSIASEKVTEYQARIDAARELKRLLKRKSALLAKV